MTVHPTKTKLVPFRPPSSTAGKVSRAGRPGTFDFLGFTHDWARFLKGYWVVKLKAASNRFSRAVRSIDSWCRATGTGQLATTAELNEKLRGHYVSRWNWILAPTRFSRNCKMSTMKSPLIAQHKDVA